MLANPATRDAYMREEQERISIGARNLGLLNRVRTLNQQYEKLTEQDQSDVRRRAFTVRARFSEDQDMLDDVLLQMRPANRLKQQLDMYETHMRERDNLKNFELRLQAVCAENFRNPGNTRAEQDTLSSQFQVLENNVYFLKLRMVAAGLRPEFEFAFPKYAGNDAWGPRVQEIMQRRPIGPDGNFAGRK